MTGGPDSRNRPRPTRFGRTTACLSVLVLFGVACSDTGTSPSATGGTETSGSTQWSYTDGRGVTTTLPTTPTTIVAQTEIAAPALLFMGIPLAGVYGDEPVNADNKALEGLDITGIQPLGEVYGEIDLESMAVMDPDIIVTVVPGPDGLPNGFTNEKQVERAEQIAPIVALDNEVSATELLDEWLRLGESLGADLDGQELTEARERYEAARSALEAAIAAKPGLTVSAWSIGEQDVYVAGDDWPDLTDFEDLGLEVVFATDTAEFDGSWQQVSWENAEDFSADVILYDARRYSYYVPPEDQNLPEIWNRLPAVEAGQYGPWRSGDIDSYQRATAYYEELTALIEGAEVVT